MVSIMIYMVVMMTCVFRKVFFIIGLKKNIIRMVMNPGLTANVFRYLFSDSSRHEAYVRFVNCDS